MTELEEAVPAQFYRDPLNVLIGLERMTCAGCLHVGLAFGSEFCEKGRQYGRRCKQYREVENGES